MITVTRSIATVACLLTVVAGRCLAQNFDAVTKNVEMDFPVNDGGVFTCRPACGVPLPEPKTMQAELGWVQLGCAGTTACAIFCAPPEYRSVGMEPRDTLAEVRDHVRRTFDILGKGGGFILSPTHAISSDIAPEKVLAIFDEAATCFYK